ncbi:MAG: PKD domain-containing protein [Chitinophagaceae bacterium]
MNRRILYALVLCMSFYSSFATHVAGGEVFYRYVGPGPTANTSEYQVTVRLYRECNSVGAALNPEVVVLGVYNTATNAFVTSQTLTRDWPGNPPQIQNDPNANPCLVPPITVCYQVGTFSGNIVVQNSTSGYTLSWIRYTRPDLNNTIPASGLAATFVTRIPGTGQLLTGNNTCPVFVVKDTSVICKGSNFTLDYGATDADGDSLAFKFTPAYDGFGGSAAGNPNPAPPAFLQLIPLTYAPPYSGTSPLGPGAVINVNTGLITGTAPASAGKYVIAVMAEEWRNGVLINQHRKDFIVTIGDCGLQGASLTPEEWSCNGFDWTFENQSTNSNIIGYLWNFGDGDTSTSPRPTHVYADTGVYRIKLKVIGGGGCADSATKLLHVFPGFFPGFVFSGACKGVPFQFTDTTKTKYGIVNNWRWDFGELTTVADTSTIKNPQYTYPTIGPKTARLIVNNSKGCLDTATVDLTVLDKPVLSVPFKDTLICAIDTLQLHATGIGNFTWTPTTRMINPTSADPFVNPQVTTTYQVLLNDRGCLATDSIKVNVLPFITVDAGPDTTICLTDNVTLRPNSQALSYRWTPTATLTNPNTKNPVAKPIAVTTTYSVTANLGKCQDRDSVTITAVPYPKADAGPDTSICFTGKATLTGTAIGSAHTWTPASLVSNPNGLVTDAFPKADTWFIFSVTDVLGCPKPAKDSVLVKVVPEVKVFAGNDTTVVIGQPLVFNASASAFATIYRWSPVNGLNNPTLLQPTLIMTPGFLPVGRDTISYMLTATSPEGCTASDIIIVKLFRVPPTIFVPTAFTPNSDGRNDIIKPILAGISRLDFFRVYNRYGQLVFQTSSIDKGWDGRINGNLQGTAAFVYTAQAVDYNGITIKVKGLFTLIR